MIGIVKPQEKDIPQIKEILSFWTEREEVDKYVERIKNEIEGKTEYNLHFWVAKEDEKVLGITGLCDPLPQVIPYTKTDKPGELKILYVDNQSRGNGVGKKLIQFLEKEAIKENYKELLVRSAKRYEETAYGFYKKMGFADLGSITNAAGKQMQVFRKVF